MVLAAPEVPRRLKMGRRLVEEATLPVVLAGPVRPVRTTAAAVGGAVLFPGAASSEATSPATGSETKKVMAETPKEATVTATAGVAGPVGVLAARQGAALQELGRDTLTRVAPAERP